MEGVPDHHHHHPHTVPNIPPPLDGRSGLGYAISTSARSSASLGSVMSIPETCPLGSQSVSQHAF